MNVGRQKYRRAVEVALGVGYALTSDPLPYEFFSSQCQNPEVASAAAMADGISRLVSRPTTR